MTEAVWIALIGGLQAITLLVLQRVLRSANSAKDDAAEVKTQVKNDHSTNLREESDERHDEIMAAIGMVRDDVTGIKKDVGRLDDRDLAHGKHHERTDKKFDDLRDDLAEHLEWSRNYVAGQEK